MDFFVLKNYGIITKSEGYMRRRANWKGYIYLLISNLLLSNTNKDSMVLAKE